MRTIRKHRVRRVFGALHFLEVEFTLQISLDLARQKSIFYVIFLFMRVLRVNSIYSRLHENAEHGYATSMTAAALPATTT